MQDPVLAYLVRAYDSMPLYDAARIGKNRILHQGYSVKHYYMAAGIFGFYHLLVNNPNYSYVVWMSSKSLIKEQGFLLGFA